MLQGWVGSVLRPTAFPSQEMKVPTCSWHPRKDLAVSLSGIALPRGRNNTSIHCSHWLLKGAHLLAHTSFKLENKTVGSVPVDVFFRGHGHFTVKNAVHTLLNIIVERKSVLTHP